MKSRGYYSLPRYNRARGGVKDLHPFLTPLGAGKRCYCESLIIGNLSNNNGNGSENVTKKAGFALFQTFFSLVPFHTIFLVLGNSYRVDSEGLYF